MFEKLLHQTRTLPDRFKDFFQSEVSLVPRKGDPDGPVEGIDSLEVAAAIHRLAQSPQMAEAWRTYDQWRPHFAADAPTVTDSKPN